MINVKQLFLPVQLQDQVVSLWHLAVLIVLKLYVKQLRQLIFKRPVYGIQIIVESGNVQMLLLELPLTSNAKPT